MKLHAIIMAGGSGSRLWPLSRASQPKQFLPLHGQDTMLQVTIERLSGLNLDSLIVICNEEHRFFVAEQLRLINKSAQIILEPVGRNTAPAIALAALTLKEDSLLLVLSADHIIEDPIAFTDSVRNAAQLADSGKLVTFGIVPSEPSTGYGYIRRGDAVGVGYHVNEFVEKPDLSLAKAYVAAGEHYWNSGMFLFKSACYLDELKKFRPDIHDSCRNAIKKCTLDGDFLRAEKISFEGCPNESVDYAVMEKTQDAVVVPIDVGWNDIGSWSSLWDISKKDANMNAVVGDVMLHETTNSYIRSDDMLLAAIGLDDLIIVATKDVVMISHKDKVQDVKSITEQLMNLSRSEWQSHREVHRPWGKYDSVDVGDRYQVKRITVKPGAKLSVQMHHHRSEHWVVVSGTAKVTNGDEVFLLAENESTYIPVGAVHALENPGKVELELIEVQTGPYLGEDDIVRIEDRYGRS